MAVEISQFWAALALKMIFAANLKERGIVLGMLLLFARTPMNMYRIQMSAMGLENLYSSYFLTHPSLAPHVS